MNQPDPPVPAIPDPRPLPPRQPELEECCGSGCDLCVFDRYDDAMERYRDALAAWSARHPEVTRQARGGTPE